MSLTRAEIIEVLEQQFAGCGFDQTRVLQISGLRYAYRANAPVCEKVVRSSVTVHGEALDMQRSYCVVANSFLADGGDGFAAFKKGTTRITAGLDIDAFTAFLKQRSPITGVAANELDTSIKLSFARMFSYKRRHHENW